MSTQTADIAAETLRQEARDAAKRHKASWIQLGQYLFSISKDKLYRGWGYLSFETYCKKELGIKEATAAKLLKSYHFLEKEEPRLVREPAPATETAQRIPDYESVNLLRLAKTNEKVTAEDFAELREAVLESAKEPKEVRAQVKKILEAKDNRSPEEERAARRQAAAKRVMSVLKGARMQLSSEGLLPQYLLKQIDDLVAKLEDQLE